MKQGFRRNSLRYKVNERFFNKWNSKLAYILGFTYADGNIYKTSLSWDVQIRDLEILLKINRTLESSYPIKLQRESSYRLRINNQILIEGAVNQGLLPKKTMRKMFPKIPEKLIKHFIRGYLDGDGWIVLRNRRNEVNIGFANGNREFLDILRKVINQRLSIRGKIRIKKKITPAGVVATTYQLEYYSTNAMHIAIWLYGGLAVSDLYLKRKYSKYVEAKTLYNLLWARTKSKSRIEREFGESMKEILLKLNEEKGLNGMQISTVLETSKSSVYRWLSEIRTK